MTGAPFVEARIDHGLGALSSASGPVPVSPSSTTTYTFVAMTTMGSVSRRCTLFVDDEPVIFEDGFEIGSTARWSATVP